MNIRQTAITEHIIFQKCLYRNEKTFISNVYTIYSPMSTFLSSLYEYSCFSYKIGLYCLIIYAKCDRTNFNR